MPRRLLKLLLAASLTGAATMGCQVNTDDPEIVCTTDPCEYASAISEANRQLSNFGGERAAELYHDAREIAMRYNPTVEPAQQLDMCRPTYGVMLGQMQQILRVFNLVVGGIIEASGALGGGDEEDGGGAPALRRLQDELPFTYAQDLADLVENYYQGNFQEAVDDISAMAATMETDSERYQECVFIADEASDVPAQAGFRGTGVPFRLLSNDSVDDLQNQPDKLAAELRIGTRWDRVEARVMHTFADSFRAVFYVLMAHDLTLTDQQWAQVRILGQGVSDVAECILGGSPFYGEPIDTAVEQELDGAVVNGVVDTVPECQEAVGIDEEGFPGAIRGLGFLVADNPRTFGEHEDNPLTDAPEDGRWSRYAADIDNRLADAFGALVGFFDDMILRTVRHADEANRSERLREYALLFDDIDQDGIVGSNDVIGIDVESFRLKLPESFGQTDALEQTVDLVIDSFLQFSIPSDQFVDSVRGIIENLSNQFAAVDDDEVTAEPFQVASLQTLISASPFFSTTPMPDAMELDFTAFFANGGEGEMAPLRTMFPHWHAVTSITFDGETVNQFIVEEELGAGAEADFFWQTTTPASAEDGDTAHFTNPDYEVFDPIEAELVEGPPAANLQPDCMDTEDEEDVPSPLGPFFGIEPDTGVIYIYLQDPSFNGLVRVKTEGIQPLCSGDVDEFEPASLRLLHRTVLAYIRWFNANCTVCDLATSL